MDEHEEWAPPQQLSHWEWLEHEWAPAQEFIKAVEGGETPSRELLAEVARILRVRVAHWTTHKRSRGRQHENLRRLWLFLQIVELRDEGMSRSDAIRVASKEHDFDRVKVEAWFETGRYADDRDMARTRADPDKYLEWFNEVEDLLMSKYPRARSLLNQIRADLDLVE